MLEPFEFRLVLQQGQPRLIKEKHPLLQLVFSQAQHQPWRSPSEPSYAVLPRQFQEHQQLEALNLA